jgi:diaminopimelate epimerase
MSPIAFTKMHGAANDFVVLDHRQPLLPEAGRAALFAAMCDRRRGIGADGVLLLESDPHRDFRMVYYNSDGGEADFCGNGARCLARFALDRGLGKDGTVRFVSAAGEKAATLLPDGRIALAFGAVGDPEDVRIEAAGRTFAGVKVAAGVPHFVVPVERVADVPLADWAPGLRRHARFGVEGANVDFVARRADGAVDMRTYERGVEGETLACGSGAIATARWAVTAGAVGPVVVRTAGGDALVVAFEDRDGRSVATLTGPAETVFTGQWPA